MRYLILYRGINVGGNNKVEMASLRIYAQELGFANVSTYINSGNLLLDADVDAATVKEALAIGFEARFGFDTRIVVIAADAFKAELAALPDWWRDDYARKYAMFYLDELDSEYMRQQLESYKLLDGEHIVMGNLALYWGVRDRSDINRAALKRHLMNEPFYQDLTLRNSNTCEKLRKIL